MVEELDTKGLGYTFMALSKNNAKSMQQPNDNKLRSGLNHFFRNPAQSFF
jgi:hypothetical protein